MSELIEHSAARRMREAKKWEDAVLAPEALALQDAVYEAMEAYFAYLESRGVVREEELLVAKRHSEGNFTMFSKPYCEIHDGETHE